MKRELKKNVEAKEGRNEGMSDVLV